MHNQNVGLIGEKRAEEYYLAQGYLLLEKNYRTPFGEFDLIFKKDATTVFVEVKCRSSLAYGTPVEAIKYKKLNTLRRSIEYFQLLRPYTNHNYRLDIVSVLLLPSGEVKHFEVYENVGV